MIVYFSSTSGYTDAFVHKLGQPALRIPLMTKDVEDFVIEDDCVLICPTYASMRPDGEVRGYVPRQVVRFLGNEANRSKVKGVIGTGNLNFGEDFARSGDSIAQKLEIPMLYRFELSGTDDDVLTVKKGLAEFWDQIKQPKKSQMS